MADIILPYREIPLTRGLVALVDEADFEMVAGHVWHAQRHERTNGTLVWYATRNAARGGTVLMHREIMDAPPNMDVDHENGNGLANWRTNLRLSTRSANLQNRRNLRANKTNPLRGVSRCGCTRPGCVQVTIRAGEVGIDGRRKSMFLGHFIDHAAAGRAFDAAARFYFGENCGNLNFPDGVE